MTHVQKFLDAQPASALSVSYVWLPQFPRDLEEDALPGMVEQFARTSVNQFWDGDTILGREFLARIVPEFLGGDAVWDTFVLFGPEATWADAGDHIIAWDYTVSDKREALFAALARLTAGAAGAVSS